MAQGDINSNKNYKPERIAYLIAAFIRNRLTMEESLELDEWLLRDQENVNLFAELTSDEALGKEINLFTSANVDQALSRVQDHIDTTDRPAKTAKIRALLPYASVAAALAVVLWLVLTRLSPGTEPQTELSGGLQDLLPGSDKAVLITADGKRRQLDSAIGTILWEGKVGPTNSKGELSYNGSQLRGEQHTLIVPNGGKYRLLLSDSTTVWLNAATTLTYPAVFGTTERRVQLNGEAYFEVRPDKTKPFYVEVNGGTVQVLGTHFNVNAYHDEASVKTTLLEGSVKFTRTSSKQEQPLKPGQQLELREGELHTVGLENPEDVIAWKSNLFEFVDEPLESIMRQVSRWYNVKVEYKGSPSVKLNASIKRDVPVSRLFEKLEKTGLVHFEIENNIIIVKP